MNARFEQAFETLEQKRKQLFAALKPYSDDLLNTKPTPEAWSVNEVVAHVLMAEEASLKYLQKKTLDTKGEKPAGFTGWRRLAMVKVLFGLPIKFKVPALVAPTKSDYRLTDLENQWAGVRHQTHVLLASLSETDLNKTIWKHAIAGKMNIYQMLDFFTIHFDRHQKQIERTLQAVQKQLSQAR